MSKLDIYIRKAKKAANLLHTAYRQKDSKVFEIVREQALKDYKDAEIELNKIGVNLCHILNESKA